jgi:uncharacterized membrane protein
MQPLEISSIRYNSDGKPMRKTLEAISLLALAILLWMTWSAFHGPEPLPERVPTHFDFAGNPNAWGSPAGLVFLPAIALALYLILSLVSCFPSAFNYPVRVTAENRPRLQALALQMMAWLKAELLCVFAWIQWMVIDAMRHGQGRFFAALGFAALVCSLGTTGWYIAAMVRAGKQQDLQRD